MMANTTVILPTFKSYANTAGLIDDNFLISVANATVAACNSNAQGIIVRNQLALGQFTLSPAFSVGPFFYYAFTGLHYIQSPVAPKETKFPSSP